MMGYRTNFYGEIKFDKDNQNLVDVLKYLREIATTDWISQARMGKSTGWFHPEDEWIGYCAFVDEENVDFVKGVITAPDYEFKDYHSATAVLCWVISQLDKTAEGKLSWSGEDQKDNGRIRIKDGKVYVGKRKLTYEIIKNEEQGWLIEHDDYIVPKHDFITLIKENRLDMKRLNQILVEGKI